jgi:hypothetical protein
MDNEDASYYAEKITNLEREQMSYSFQKNKLLWSSKPYGTWTPP